MKSNCKRTQCDYSLAFKLAVVDKVEAGELTYKQAQSRYGIQGRSTVLVWLRKHGRLDWSSGTSLPGQRTNIMSDKPIEPTPEQRIKELEQQLAEAKLKADFFETVVDVLKRDHRVQSTDRKKVSRQVIEERQVTGLTVSRACQILGISRQAYYQQGQTVRATQDTPITGSAAEGVPQDYAESSPLLVSSELAKAQCKAGESNTTGADLGRGYYVFTG